MQHSQPSGFGGWLCLLCVVGCLWLPMACCRSLAEDRCTFHNHGRTSPWECTLGPVGLVCVPDKHRKVKEELGKKDGYIYRGMGEGAKGDWVVEEVLVQWVGCALEGSGSRLVEHFDSARRFGKRRACFFRGVGMVGNLWVLGAQERLAAPRLAQGGNKGGLGFATGADPLYVGADSRSHISVEPEKRQTMCCTSLPFRLDPCFRC